MLISFLHSNWTSSCVHFNLSHNKDKAKLIIINFISTNFLLLKAKKEENNKEFYSRIIFLVKENRGTHKGGEIIRFGKEIGRRI